MNIRDLIEQLENLAEEHGDETDVRIAHQPSWPFEYEINSVEAVDLNADSGHPDEGHEDSEEPDALVVYLAEGSQLGYLPGAAVNALGWGR